MQPLKIGHVFVYILGLMAKDDVVSILVQVVIVQKCILQTLIVRFHRGNAPFLIQRVISLVPESKQQKKHRPMFVHHLDLSHL